ncbi:MAG TPA: RodZ domain-containing protein [Candidatus Nanopelagicaceae bacterium]|jgi:transcriptional regulator with XRE-family HTH domain
MSLGTSIKEARKRVGMSIEKLAERTSIRAALLREFEADDFSKCGGDTYARGHVRNIANALSVEPATFLDLYVAEQTKVERPMYDLLLENKVTPPANQKPRFSLKVLSTISASAVVLVIGGQIAYTNFQPAKGSSTKSLILATSPANTTSPTPSASPSTPSVPVTSTPVAGAVNVAVTASRGPSWLSVSNSAGVSLFSGRLVQGQSQTFSDATSISIRFGNAGAVDVLVNGTPSPVPGAMGEVVDRTYGSNSVN